jgi:hypothetical protein
VNDFDLIVRRRGSRRIERGGSGARRGAPRPATRCRRFPRVKPCAGDVTLKAAAALRYALDPSVCRSFDTIEFNLWGKRNRFSHPGVVL